MLCLTIAGGCAAVGKPIVENCLNGYNSSILAYGQTGSGKTHTMVGELPARSASLPAEVRNLCKCCSLRSHALDDPALGGMPVMQLLNPSCCLIMILFAHPLQCSKQNGTCSIRQFSLGLKFSLSDGLWAAGGPNPSALPAAVQAHA